MFDHTCLPNHQGANKGALIITMLHKYEAKGILNTACRVRLLVPTSCRKESQDAAEELHNYTIREFGFPYLLSALSH